MMQPAIAALLACAVWLPHSAGAQASAPAAVTIVLVRHAEAVPDAGTDPGLSDAGTARAAALVETLKDAQVAAVITSQFRRTILTGQPLAAAMRAPLVTMTIEPGAAGLAAHVRDLVDAVHATYSSRTVVIVGHSNTIPALVRGLTGIDPGQIAHDSYDRLFIVTVRSPGSGSLIRARYGQAPLH